MDAAIAVNLVLGVATPYLCGYGGDLFALVWKDGLHGYNGSGRAPKAATPERLRDLAHSDRVPQFGPLTVTVPGAVEGWFALLDRFGTRSFGDLAEPALGYARDGFTLSEAGAASLRRAAGRYAWSPEWMAVYGIAEAGQALLQPGLARTIEVVAAEGPDAYYRGSIGRAIVDHLRSRGGILEAEDLDRHRGEWATPLSTAYRGVEVFELPPNTQGVTALEALNIVEALGSLPPDGPDRHHLLIEAMKLALADRDAYVTDPSTMRIEPELLASAGWAKERAHRFDRSSASDPLPGRPSRGGTAYMCAADAEGMCVSLIQSNWEGFGSGVTVPGWGINLHNRGQYFSLDPSHPNVIGPGKRTLHTLIPAMATREGRPWLVWGTMGGDGQAQTHLQLLARIVDDGEDVQRAIDAPRWVIDTSDWSVTAEERFEAGVIGGLRHRGHRVRTTAPYDSVMGHAHAILVSEGGYACATDPRAEGAALGG